MEIEEYRERMTYSSHNKRRDFSLNMFCNVTIKTYNGKVKVWKDNKDWNFFIRGEHG